MAIIANGRRSGLRASVLAAALLTLGTSGWNALTRCEEPAKALTDEERAKKDEAAELYFTRPGVKRFQTPGS